MRCLASVCGSFGQHVSVGFDKATSASIQAPMWSRHRASRHSVSVRDLLSRLANLGVVSSQLRAPGGPVTEQLDSRARAVFCVPALGGRKSAGSRAIAVNASVRQNVSANAVAGPAEPPTWRAAMREILAPRGEHSRLVQCSLRTARSQRLLDCLAFNAANGLVAKLSESGLLCETTGGERRGRFAYDRDVSLLRVGPEGPAPKQASPRRAKTAARR